MIRISDIVSAQVSTVTSKGLARALTGMRGAPRPPGRWCEDSGF